MENRQPRRRSRARTSAWAVALGLGLSGCGEAEDYANDPRQPSPVSVTAAVNEERVSISPNKVGAGPTNVIVANLSDQSQEVMLEASEGANSADTSTGPINPQGTASIKLNLQEGVYRLTAGGARIAILTVGPERDSAQDELLLP